MSQIVQQPPPPIDHETLERVLLTGDLYDLSPRQRLDYYQAVCKSVGLNPLTQPFAYLELNRKLVLYALKSAADQLRRIHSVSVIITGRETFDGVHTVSARATLPSGRTDESIGAVYIAGLRGENLANAYMKTDTKARRRVTLSICGLSLLDESEVETIQGARAVAPEAMHADNVVALPSAAERAAQTGGVVEMLGGKLRALKTVDELAAWWCEVAGHDPQEPVRKTLWGMLSERAHAHGLNRNVISTRALALKSQQHPLHEETQP